MGMTTETETDTTTADDGRWTQLSIPMKKMIMTTTTAEEEGCNDDNDKLNSGVLGSLSTILSTASVVANTTTTNHRGSHVNLAKAGSSSTSSSSPSPSPSPSPSSLAAASN